MPNNNQVVAGRTILCGQCGKSCSGIQYSFAVNVACESCVRAFYQGSTEIEEELRCRTFDALRMIARQDNRRRKGKTPSDTHLCDVCGGSHYTENCRVDF
jgi:DNA-directed RNA polymerase alpha subunit